MYIQLRRDRNRRVEPVRKLSPTRRTGCPPASWRRRAAPAHLEEIADALSRLRPAALGRHDRDGQARR
ncbi:nickel transporter, partial [Burkholderia pseudomallei]